MAHVIYKNSSTFQKKHIGQYSEGIDVAKVENFHLLVAVFQFFFVVFTVYNLNNSYFIYINCYFSCANLVLL